MDERPLLSPGTSIEDFRDFYWLKKELTEFCRTAGLKTSGSKSEITKRIEYFLKTGNRKKDIHNGPKVKRKTKSEMDWHKSKLILETRIDENYKNTQNVRRFFLSQIGPHFKFNIKFMKWMKSNSGKTLKDAIEAWQKIKIEISSDNKPKVIAPQFEYNRYLRDFMSDNPKSKRKVGIQLWNIKKKLRGDNTYQKEDLDLLES